MGNNCCRSVPAPAPEGTVGRRLDLSNRSLTSLPESVGIDLTVSSLDISYNKISKIPKRFQKFSSLKQLFIRSNALAKYGIVVRLCLFLF